MDGQAVCASSHTGDRDVVSVLSGRPSGKTILAKQKSLSVTIATGTMACSNQRMSLMHQKSWECDSSGADCAEMRLESRAGLPLRWYRSNKLAGQLESELPARQISPITLSAPCAFVTIFCGNSPSALHQLFSLPPRSACGSNFVDYAIVVSHCRG
ncbi:hypothetical protein BDW69DRAFT_132209 [Aspergillus filifer]